MAYVLVANKEINSLPNSRISLKVTIGKDSVESAYNDTLKETVAKAKIDGFRPGKAPVNVIETRYKAAIESQVLENLINKAFQEAISEIEDKPLQSSRPNIKLESTFSKDTDLVFTAEYDVFPKVEIDEAKSFEITVPQVEVSDADVEKELSSLQDRYATVLELPEGSEAKKGDIVIVDFSELDENKQEIPNTKRESFTFTLGNAQNIYGFDEEIWGMKKGEERVFEKEISKDSPNTELAGKKVTLKVILKKLQEKQLPSLDDDFAQDINEKFKTLEDLKKHVKDSMERQLKEKLESDEVNQILDSFIEVTPFELPESLVDWQMEEQWNQIARQSNMNVADLERIFGGSKKNMEEAWRGDIVLSLKRQIILESLLGKKKVEVSDEDLQNEYKDQASLYGMEVSEIEKHFSSNNMIERLKYDISLKKLKSTLIKDAKVKKGDKLDFASYMEGKA